MSFKNIPFYIVLLASVLPWFAAAANSKMLTYIPDALALIAYVLFMARYPGRAFRINPYFALVLLLVALHMAFGMVSGRGIGSGGLVALFVLTFIFSKLLLDQGEGVYSEEAITISRQISLIYKIHIMFILTELIIRLNGHTDFLTSIAGYATEVTKYKMHNGAQFLTFLGFDDISGMNSMLLGSQTASQLVLFACFLFVPLYKGYSLKKGGLSSKFWFIFSLALFPFVVSMTAVGIMVLLILFMVYILPNTILNRRSIWIILPLLAVAFSSVLFPLVTYRIQTPADLEAYRIAFTGAPLRFLELPLLDQIMGHGANTGNLHIIPDFGLGMVTYAAGFFLVGLALICLTQVILRVCRVIRRDSSTGFSSSPWTTLAGINIVLSIGWAISLVHYTPALELGGKHLFAMHLAVCLVALKRMVKIRRSTRHINLQVKE